jgi:hypothetical protein
MIASCFVLDGIHFLNTGIVLLQFHVPENTSPRQLGAQ